MRLLRGGFVAVYLSRRVMLDIDTPEDIEFLRGGGSTAAFRFLREKTAVGYWRKI